MKKNIYGILVAAALLCGCDRGYEVVKSFPVEESIEAKRMYAADDSAYIIDLFMAGKYSVGQIHKDVFFYRVYDENHEAVTDFCRKGRGPGEFIAPYICDVLQTDSSGFSMAVLDRPTGKYYNVVFDRAEDSVKIGLKADFGVPLRKVYDMGGSYILSPDDGTYEYHSDVDTIVFESSYEAYDGDTPSRYEQTLSVMDSCRDKLVSVYMTLPKIDLYTSDGVLLKTVYVYSAPSKIPFDYSGGFKDVVDAGECLLALYESHEGDGINELFVFDWNLRPKAVLRLNAESVIDYDKNTKTLTAFNSDDGIVSVYDVSEYL